MRHPDARRRASREERRRKREARLFYELRQHQRKHGADVLPEGEAKAMSPWRGCAVALLAIAVAAALLAAARFFV